MQSTTDTTINKSLAQRFLELVSDGNAEGLCKLVTADRTMHGGPPNLPLGPGGVRQLFATFGTIKQQWTIEDIFAEGDKVVVRAINTCTQDSFMGVPAHGKQQIFSAMFIHHVIGGKVKETWRAANDLGRLLQLGARITSSHNT
jgi:hypothetical protein